MTETAQPQPNPFLTGVAEIIAASRYRQWDAHAHTLTWREYVEEDPETAEGIYRTDGRADAQALEPFLVVCLNTARSEVYKHAAELVADSAPEQAAVLRVLAAQVDPKQTGAYAALITPKEPTR